MKRFGIDFKRVREWNEKSVSVSSWYVHHLIDLQLLRVDTEIDCEHLFSREAILSTKGFERVAFLDSVRA